MRIISGESSRRFESTGCWHSQQEFQQQLQQLRNCDPLELPFAVGINFVYCRLEGECLELLGLMVSANDPTSGIRARGHGFDSCMLQICAGAGGRVVGLNGPASCPVAGGHVGQVMFEMA
uniref:Uncharacterized protein n=1 Tax=Ananas comosus var. bracteatus TaxID=296719 RepID=A0A6V7QCB2_ANACO|nr:unnamed protein product [Ananas comosus var. bracteatus]